MRYSISHLQNVHILQNLVGIKGERRITRDVRFKVGLLDRRGLIEFVWYGDIVYLRGSADLTISKSALLSFNNHNFSNTELIYTK